MAIRPKIDAPPRASVNDFEETVDDLRRRAQADAAARAAGGVPIGVPRPELDVNALLASAAARMQHLESEVTAATNAVQFLGNVVAALYLLMTEAADLGSGPHAVELSADDLRRSQGRLTQYLPTETGGLAVISYPPDEGDTPS